MLAELRKPTLRFLDELSVAIIGADTGGRVLYLNRAAMDLFGVTAEEILGRSLVESARRAEAVSAQELLNSWTSGEAQPFYLKVPTAKSTDFERMLGIPALIRNAESRFLGALICFIPLSDVNKAARNYMAVLTSLARESISSLMFELRKAESELEQSAPSGRLRMSSPEFNTLSTREWDVANLLLEGLRPGEIATRLGVSIATIRNHLKSIYRKSGVSSQVAFVAKARGSSDRIATPMFD